VQRAGSLTTRSVFSHLRTITCSPDAAQRVSCALLIPGTSSRMKSSQVPDLRRVISCRARFQGPNHGHFPRVSRRHTRGVSRSSRRLVRNAMDVTAVNRRVMETQTAKSCGPNIPTLISTRDNAFASRWDGGKKARSPGRAVNTVCAGKAGFVRPCPAVTARVRFLLQTRLRVQPVRCIPCALVSSRVLFCMIHAVSVAETWTTASCQSESSAPHLRPAHQPATSNTMPAAPATMPCL
jgi:hypothetical protein